MRGVNVVLDLPGVGHRVQVIVEGRRPWSLRFHPLVY